MNAPDLASFSVRRTLAWWTMVALQSGVVHGAITLLGASTATFVPRMSIGK